MTQTAKKSPFSMNVDLMHGPIFKNLLLFMLPIFISNLFQQLYNTVDTMIVGNVLGDTALAAIVEQGQLTGTVTEVTFKGMHYDIIVDLKGFKWLIQTTDFSPVGARIGVKIDPDGFHIMKKSRYSGMFGDYSSYSAEYEELNEESAEGGDEE